MGRKSFRKGRQAEYEVKSILEQHGFKVQRVPLSGSTEFAKGDLVITKIDKLGRPSETFLAEVKRRADGFKELYKFLEGRRLCFLRADRKGWLVVVRLADFLEMTTDAGHS